MTFPIFTPQYRAIVETRYLLNNIESSIEQIHSKENFSIFNLVKPFRLTEKEREKHLENKGLFDRLHFNFIGENYLIDKRLKEEITFNKVLQSLILKKMNPLEPSQETKNHVRDIFIYKKYILENLRVANRCSAAISITFAAAMSIWVGYNCIRILSDWNKYCSQSSQSPTGQIALDELCPTNHFFSYFWSINKTFFAMPALVILSLLIQNIDNELIAKLLFSPLDSVRNSATSMLNRISKIKDFLIDKASDSSFIKPHFEKL